MELLILIVCLVILAEATILFAKSEHRPLLSTSSKRKLYVDTSALMDVRLIAVAKTGFISDDLIIPRSVIHELQLLADGKDHDKRARARAGLDAVRELERIVYFNVTILNDALDRTPVDNRLLELASSNKGAIMTNDYNLQKVAATTNIDVLNLNELALALRNEHLPGDRTKLKLLTTGSGTHQGVGYLSDGTMVVVDQADHKIGQEVEVEFHHINQTAAGTMLFAKLANSQNSAPKSSKTTKNTKTKVSQVAKALKTPTRKPKAKSTKSNSKTAKSNHR